MFINPLLNWDGKIKSSNNIAMNLSLELARVNEAQVIYELVAGTIKFRLQDNDIRNPEVCVIINNPYVTPLTLEDTKRLAMFGIEVRDLHELAMVCSSLSE